MSDAGDGEPRPWNSNPYNGLADGNPNDLGLYLMHDLGTLWQHLTYQDPKYNTGMDLIVGPIKGLSTLNEIRPGFGDPKKWTYTVQDPTKFRPISPPSTPYNINPKGKTVLIILSIGVIDVIRRMGFDSNSARSVGKNIGKNVTDIYDGIESFMTDLKNKTVQGLYDVQSGVNNATWPGR